MSTATTSSAQDGGPAWSARVGRVPQALPTPGPVFGSYPLKPPPQWPGSAAMAWLEACWKAPPAALASEARRLVAQVRREQVRWQALAATAQDLALARLRAGLSIEGFTPVLAARAMALVAVHVERRLGWQVHDGQLAGAWWMLGQRLIEMATGEGKSLTVVLTAGTAALGGVPVHVMTANDYLARRDAVQWAGLYEALGLTVSSVVAGSTVQERRLAYLADVVYVTAKEVAFDHLRDRAASDGQGPEGEGEGRVLRGLCMAVIDEADSILIDEACTPLVLSQAVQARDAAQRHRLALFLARQMAPGRDFHMQSDGLAVSWLDEGARRLEQLGAGLQGPWRLRRYREEQVALALTALHGLLRDVHYLVRDDEVHIIDATTGRLALGRAWSRGLHQMVCLKESVPCSPETETLIQTTYQQFFPRYHRLCGLSGTLGEERRELLAVYGLPVVRVPLRRPVQRRDEGLCIEADIQAKWRRVADRAGLRAAKEGRAVLIGTDTVADSEALSAVLSARGIAHQVLNARQDGHEGDAERAIIEAAGEPGAVTVATHMAGRGTDIAVRQAVLDRGGLHVINTHLNPSARIDRQLYGRAARQGQPGSCECVLSWQDDALVSSAPARLVRLLGVALGTRSRVLKTLEAGVCRWVQRRQAAQAGRRRWTLLQVQVAMKRQLAWAGKDEWT